VNWNWLQDNIAAILQWLQRYKAGYLVFVLIAARITWRLYKALSSRTERAKRAPVAVQPGQAALAAIQEVVRMLETDPDADWSTVNLTALHEHLVDIDEMLLRAAAKEQPTEGGLQIEISGVGRTLRAIQRLLPAHANKLNQRSGWEARSEHTADGVVLTVTSTDPNEVSHIRGLGFFGLLATAEAQHQHLAMARGA
jgi:hypothetical protein